jgi:hypothetical protein
MKGAARDLGRLSLRGAEGDEAIQILFFGPGIASAVAFRAMADKSLRSQ